MPTPNNSQPTKQKKSKNKPKQVFGLEKIPEQESIELGMPKKIKKITKPDKYKTYKKAHKATHDKAVEEAHKIASEKTPKNNDIENYIKAYIEIYKEAYNEVLNAKKQKGNSKKFPISNGEQASQNKETMEENNIKAFLIPKTKIKKVIKHQNLIIIKQEK